MRNITEIDRNFAALTVEQDGMRTWDVRKAPFSIHGLYRPEVGGVFRRMPQEVADTVNDGVKDFCRLTAGGHIRFKTDSKRFVLKWRAPYFCDFPHMPRTGTAFFDLYANGQHIHTFIPNDPQETADGLLAEAMVTLPFDGMNDIVIYFPLYNAVYDLSLALEEQATVLPADPYAHTLPIVYYGSSITHGGCVSRAGMAYPAILQRRLNTETVNLGFSGSCRAEPAMADYIATLPMRVFVYDYDHNAPDPAFLEATHEPFFKQVRKQRPDLPIVMVSAAEAYLPGGWDVRREIIRRTYENAVASDDKNVYFLDGHTFYDGAGGRDCLVDNTHPNDLGMWCMANAMEPLLKKLL